mgnify:CR=1 FL=1
MLEIIELCRKYGISISFDPMSDSDMIIVRLFDPSTNRASNFMICYQVLDNVVDKKTYVDNTIGPIIHSFVTENNSRLKHTPL